MRVNVIFSRPSESVALTTKPLCRSAITATEQSRKYDYLKQPAARKRTLFKGIFVREGMRAINPKRTFLSIYYQTIQQRKLQSPCAHHYH